MTEENPTPPPADVDQAKQIADALAAQAAKFDEIMARAGTSNVDAAALADAKQLLKDAEDSARASFKARDEAKNTAKTADERITEMAAKLRASEVRAAAAEAGATNPALMASLIADDADVATRIGELKTSDPYLFGGTSTASTGGAGGGLDLGQAQKNGDPDPLAQDDGLKSFGAEMAQIAGLPKK